METLTQPDELLPCPFCNAKPKTQKSYGIRGAEVLCFNEDCQVHPSVFMEAISGPDSSLMLDEAQRFAFMAWNTRFETRATPRIDDQVDVEALEQIDMDMDVLKDCIPNRQDRETFLTPIHNRVKALIQKAKS